MFTEIMVKKSTSECTPQAEAVLKSQMVGCDDMRLRYPVVHSGYLNWSLFRHENMVRALLTRQDLRILIEKLRRSVGGIVLVSDKDPVNAYPAGALVLRRPSIDHVSAGCDTAAAG